MQGSQWLEASSAKVATRATADVSVAAYALQYRSALVAHHFPTKSAKKRKSLNANSARRNARDFAPAVVPTIEPIEALAATRARQT